MPMGVNNRQRRAAKAKQRAKNRARAQAGGSSYSDFLRWTETPEFLVGAACIALRHLVSHRLDGDAVPPADVEQFTRHEVAHQQLAIDDLLSGAVESLVAHGWTPRDLAEIAARRVSDELAAHLRAVVAVQTARQDPGRVAPRWRAELDGAETTASSRDWASRHGIAWGEARDDLIGLLCALATLPPIEPVTAASGQWQPGVGEAHGVDERILGKVRALLAKAESTEFEDEADALTAKAQELMTTYAIERALAESTETVRRQPAVRRMWIDAPYVDGKAMLVNQVADSNRSRCVLSKECGFVTLVGFAADLDTVELLSTSLLLQASRLMRSSGRHRTRWGTSNTRSFRQSFLVAYADRIGERLREAATGTESRADAEHHGTLLPVLVARGDEVADFTAKLFPGLVSRSLTASNAAGWAAGRAAADLALFDIRDSVERAG